MTHSRRLIIGTVMAAGVIGGVLMGGAATAQAQGVMGGTGFYPVSGNYPTGAVTVAQFPAVGLDPPYNPTTIGVAPTPDLTVFLGRADAAPPLAGTFPLAFMTQQPPSPISR
jgi:hypothetical protein